MHAHFGIALALQSLLTIGILFSLLFYLASYAEARRFFRRRRGSRRGDGRERQLSGMTVLKPLKGLDVDLYCNLSTFCEQDYPVFQILFGVADAGDPAVRVVRQLQVAYPGLDIGLVIDRRVYGTNSKVSNLHNMYRDAKHDLIVIADSDIRVGRDYLRRLAAELQDPGVGLVTCLYRAVNTGGLPTLVETLLINTDFVPMVMVARVVEKPSYAFGATMALRRSTLDAIGGFLPLANYLADDYHLGHRVVERGFRLVLSDVVVETVLATGSWRRLLDHQLRWARTNRNCRPAGYFASIMTHGTLWALLNLLYNHFSPIACLLAALVYAVRAGTARAICNRYLEAPITRAAALLLPLKDLFVSAVWGRCFLGDRVRWSGNEFRVLKNGHIVLVAPAASTEPAVVAYPPVREERDRYPASL
ncbi:MAG: bacteriohopanetetrol glucosamine biosynthesis glycosyltransferase HpnI [Candidatus Binatia bacterium]|jgi:ceramide glucosyltransferase